MRFIYPPTLESGDVLCKVHLTAYRLNDEYFNGVADALRPIWHGVSRNIPGTDLSITAYDGRHLLRSDAKTLCFYLFADGEGNTVTTKLYYDDSKIAEISSSGTPQTYADEVDLSSKAEGLYRVHAIISRDAVGSGGSGGLRAPYTRYTGTRGYVAPPTIADGSVSDAAHFQAWSNNDLYFRDMIHPNPAFSGHDWSLPEGTSFDLWHGWDRYNPEQHRLWYSCWLEKTDGGSKIRIYYDFGGSHQQYLDLTSAGWHTSYWDLGSPSNYTRGNYYQVRVRLLRDEQYNWTKAYVRHLFMGAVYKDPSYTVQGQFSAGQYVYGNTSGQSTRLSLLSSNDAAIRDRLIWNDSTTGRQDYAVAMPEWDPELGTGQGRYSLPRRFDLLYYRGKWANLEWGSKSFSLPNYDDPDTPYSVVNLNSLGVPRGVVYTITGSDLQFAMEVPS